MRLTIAGIAQSIECAAVSGMERVGDASSFDVQIATEAPIATKQAIGQPCTLNLGARSVVSVADRNVAGVVTAITAEMTSRADLRRRYRVEVRSALWSLSLRRGSRVWQHRTVPDIVREVVAAAGYRGDRFVSRLQTDHEPRRYVTQYDESDLSFARRLCEDEGLYFRCTTDERGEVLVLDDASASAPAGATAAIRVVERFGVDAADLIAVNCREARRRRPGRATLRDYDPARPGLKLEGVARAGTVRERDTDVYVAPGGFRSPDEGARRATMALESIRGSAKTITFQTNAVAVQPGTSIELACADDYTGLVRPQGKHFVVAVQHEWSANEGRHEMNVEALPLGVPYRLPRLTERPRARGVHTAIVTGALGAEIHPDESGCVFVRFPWDRDGPSDQRSSLPVRTMQPNTPGSMLLPRVGWEVWVMFEDDDPDRPYVIGRSYDGKQLPPVSLPANKTMTSLATYSSPGAGRQNAITYDDAAGRQHLAITAASGKRTVVANDATIQTAKVETEEVGGDLRREVSGAEDISIGQAFVAALGSQDARVGGSQRVFVKGSFVADVGSETVLVGGALLEQVGDPATGLVNLAKTAALQGASSLGTAGAVLSAAGGAVMGVVDAAKHGGASGAASAVGMGALGIAVSAVPGGEAVLASVQNAAAPAPWHPDVAKPGEHETGGGAGGAASDRSTATLGGAGHRDHVVKGTVVELVGATQTIVTPGSIGWKTTGASTFLVGGSHTTKTASAHHTTTGVSTEVLGGLHVASETAIVRTVTGALNVAVAGAYTSKSGGAYNVKGSGALDVKIGTDLDLDGATVTFQCGTSKVAASGAGVLIEAETITVTGASKQSSKADHA